jgi:hypothetical protein
MSTSARFSFLAMVIFLLSSLPVWAEDAAPATPREFHDQEMQRLRQAIEEPQNSALLSTQADYDAVYYDLTVDFRSYSSHTIAGKLNMTARSVASDLDQLILDLCGTLTVDSVFVDGVVRPYTRASNRITISLARVYGYGEFLTARVVYHGTPCQTNIFQSFSYYNRNVDGRTIPSIATLSEPYGSKDWWPCKDIVADKADSVRVSIIVADTITATSNGVLESLTAIPPTSRKFTYVERYPISTYLVCASATNYAHFSSQYVTLTGDTMPLEFYAYPERFAAAQVSWDNLPDMITYYAGVFGEYPFVGEQYGMTMFNFSGGMEHQTNTSYGYNITTGGHDYDYIMAHELAHQWWGDEVTCGTWADIWLNEGFASYCEALWQENLYGAQAMHDWQNMYNIPTDPSGPVYNPTDLFSGNTVYNKGSWILHMTRGVINNDSLFFAALRQYGQLRQYSNATTAQFFSDFQSVLGYDVEPYLHAYIYRTNRPTFRVAFGTGTVDGLPKTVVRIRQVQTNPDTTFTTRLDIRLTAGTDTARYRVEDYDWRQRFYFSAGFRPTAVEVDPDNWVLKNLISETLPLTILNDTLDMGFIDSAYVDSLVTIGGAGTTRTWTILSGSLPPDFSLAPNGVITGIPSQSGTFSACYRVQDTGSGADTLCLSITIPPILPPTQQLTVYPLSSDIVRLRWSTNAAADSYYVYRANRVDFQGMERIAATADTVVLDTIPTDDPNAVRFYIVTAVRNPSLP